MSKVTLLHYNWHPSGIADDQWGEDFTIVEVGVRGVTEIREHSAGGEGDRWYYDVYHGEHLTSRIFNPNYVEYQKEGEQ